MSWQFLPRHFAIISEFRALDLVRARFATVTKTYALAVLQLIARFTPVLVWVDRVANDSGGIIEGDR